MILSALDTTHRVVEEDKGDEDDDGQGGEPAGPKRADIASVYGEMGAVLVPRVIPRNALGEQFRYILYCLYLNHFFFFL